MRSKEALIWELQDLQRKFDRSQDLGQMADIHEQMETIRSTLRTVYGVAI